MNSLTHSLKMRSDSWHSRWYHHWLKLGGKKPAFKEDLCHYMRVLFIWAPLRWFFKGRIKKCPPYLAFLILMLVVALGLSLYLIPGKVAKGFLLIILWIGACAMVLAIGVGGQMLHDEKPEAVEAAAKWATVPIWILPLLLVRLLKKLKRPFAVAGRWCVGHKYHGFTPLQGMFSVVGVGVLGLLLNETYLHPLKALLIVGAIIGTIVVLVLIVLVTSDLDEGEHSRIRRFFVGVADTVKLVVTYLNTKKKGSRICPFISFDEPSS